MNKIKAFLAVVFIVAGLVGFYMLPANQEALRISTFVGSVVLAAAILWFSTYGRSFVNYARDSIKEAQKVVWPTRKETWQMTAMVFMFVAVLSLFMWLVDSGLSWVMYDLLLGQK